MHTVRRRFSLGVRLGVLLATALWGGSVSAAPDFVGVDFTWKGKAPATVTALHDAKALPVDKNGLPFAVEGPDPQLELPEWKPSSGPNWCYLRVRAESAGMWQLFTTHPAQEQHSVRFRVEVGVPRDVWIPLPAGDASKRLRLDPPGDAKQEKATKVRIERLELASEKVVTPFKITIKDWSDPSALHIGRPGPMSVHPSLAVAQGPGGTFLSIFEMPPEATQAQAYEYCGWGGFAGMPDSLPPSIRSVDWRPAYSRFFAVLKEPRTTEADGTAHSAYWSMPQGVENLAALAPEAPSLPTPKSKKGLQVQMLDDALALGVQHAALNVNLSQLFDAKAAAEMPEKFSPDEKAPLDLAQIAAVPVKPLSDAGVRVSLILLVYPSGRPELDRVLLHPKSTGRGEGRPVAWNLDSPRSIRWLTAVLEALAARYAAVDVSQGRAVQWIVGNEVNSHSIWHSLGPAGSLDVAEQYEREVRLVQNVLFRYSNQGRAFVSLDHFWGRAMNGDARGCLAGKELLTLFRDRARGAGDFPWQVAYHPYPEDLFNPKFWEDRSPTVSFDTPRITFKNLDVLTKFLAQPDWRFQGEPRRAILSEQGFHSPPGEAGETLQAAAYCAAYRRVAGLDGVDAFILHRHVDHAQEGGLDLGLWTHRPGTIATPDRRKKIYEVFQAADRPDWEAAFRFALPIVGREGKGWD